MLVLPLPLLGGTVCCLVELHQQTKLKRVWNFFSVIIDDNFFREIDLLKYSEISVYS